MAITTIDRMTINWTGEHDVAIARKFRQLVGMRNVNKIVKQLVKEWVRQQEQASVERA